MSERLQHTPQAKQIAPVEAVNQCVSRVPETQAEPMQSAHKPVQYAENAHPQSVQSSEIELQSQAVECAPQQNAPQCTKRKPLRRGLAAFVSVLAIFALLAVLSLIFMPKTNEAQKDASVGVAESVEAEPENTMDVLFFGDSACYSAISPLHMFAAEGFTSFDVATSSQRPHITFSLIRKVLKTQHPKILVMEADCLFNTSYNFSNCVMQCIEDIFPVFTFHNRWKDLTPADVGFDEAIWIPDQYKGLYMSTDVVPVTEFLWDTPARDIDEPILLSQMYAHIIAAYCKYKDVQLVLLSVPSTKNMTAVRHEVIAQLADDLGVDYIDLNTGATKSEIDWASESRDGGDHLNYYGAVHNSLQLAPILSERYDLPDHRDDPAYASWWERYASLICAYPVY